MKSEKRRFGIFFSASAALGLAGAVASHGQIQPSSANGVRIVVNVPADTPEDGPVYLTGDLPEACSWRPDCIQMKKIGWQVYETTLPPTFRELRLQFKITRGSWETEASNGHGDKLPNFVFDGADGETESVVTIVGWLDQPPLGITGNVVRHRAFKSTELGNRRDILVWLPPGYDSQGDRYYPVIYMHDGQNVFDPKTSTFGVDWGVDETLTRMIERGQAREAIVVAIASTKNREAEYTWSLRGREYARFLVDEVKPFIDSRYRTDPARESTFTMGSSMGAVISVALTWMYPDVFSAAGAVALPAFVEGDELHRLIREEGRPSDSIRIYMDHGTLGQDGDYRESAEAFHQLLCDQGMKDDEEVLYRVFDYSGHSESDWARRVEIPLDFLLGR